LLGNREAAGEETAGLDIRLARPLDQTETLVADDEASAVRLRTSRAASSPQTRSRTSSARPPGGARGTVSSRTRDRARRDLELAPVSPEDVAQGKQVTISLIIANFFLAPDVSTDLRVEDSISSDILQTVVSNVDSTNAEVPRNLLLESDQQLDIVEVSRLADEGENSLPVQSEGMFIVVVLEVFLTSFR
jgi:hypothetical protein